MSYIRPHNAIQDNELLRSPTENAVFDALATKQDTGNYITQLTGEVTASGPGSVSATITNNAVTNSKLAQVAYGTFKGRKTAGTGNVEDLNQADATALLNTFTSTLQGLVPASGGGASDFLRADGTWVTISIPASANPYLSNLLSPTAINQVLLGLDGTALAPAYSFTNSPATGIYSSAVNYLNFSTNGTNRLQIESDGKIKIIGTSGANLLWNTDGGGDIGTISGGGRPDNIYVKTNLNVSTLTTSTVLTVDISKNIISLVNGSEGQVLKIVSGVPVWATDATGMSNPMTTQGDIIVGGVAGAATKLGLGTVDKVLVSNGTTVTYQYAGLGGGSFGTGNIILGAGLPAGFTSTNNLIIGEGTIPTLKQDGSFNQDANTLLGKAISLSGNFTRATVAVGYGASVNGESSIAIGAGSSATSGIVIGQNRNASPYSVNIGGAVANYGVSIGYDSNVFGSGLNSVSIGYRSTVGTGNNCISIGYRAGAYNQYNKNGNDTIVIGANSGNAMTTSANTVVIGNSTATALTSGANNTIVGQGTATALTTGNNNTIIGQNSGTELSTGSENVIIGWYAGVTSTTYGVSTGYGNTCIGRNAGLDSATNQSFGVSVGLNAGANTNAIALGAYSRSRQSGIALGYSARAWDKCISIGENAAWMDYGGTGNFIVGYYATNPNVDSNIAAFGGTVANTANFGTAYWGQGINNVAGASLTNFKLTVTPAYGTNQSAATGTFTIAGAQGTGTGTGGDVLISTAPASTAGSIRNSLVERFRVTAAGNVKLSTSLSLKALNAQIGTLNVITATTNDCYIGVDTSSNAKTVNLPAAATAGQGFTLIIKDESGNALTNNITIARNGSDTIEGAASNLLLANNREAAYLISDGVSNWNRI